MSRAALLVGADLFIQCLAGDLAIGLRGPQAPVEIGGVGSLVGGVIGALVLLVLEEIAVGYTRDWSFYVGLALVFIVLVARGGIAGVVLGRHRNV